MRRLPALATALATLTAQEDIVCFADRWAWCGTRAVWRRIVPADMATKHVGYNRPSFDEQRRKLLKGYLLEIHGDLEIVMWRMGLKSRALQKGQAGPVCLSSQGAAGRLPPTTPPTTQCHPMPRSTRA